MVSTRPRPSSRWHRWLVAATVAVAAGASAAEPSPPAGEWNFQVLLDGKPVGRHRFALEASGDGQRLSSEARFDVRILGFTAYRYRHSAVEQWRGACLASLVSTTDDDGAPSEVRFSAQGDRQVIRVSATQAEPVEGCVMSFAYWHPAMKTQSRLLNAQTGKLEPVQVRRIADAPIDVHGETVTATGYRVSGPARPIDVWYAPDGRWIGLDSVVGDRHTLSFRLR